MNKKITIISSEELPVEDLFRGDHNVYPVQGLEDTYVAVRKEEEK